MYPDQQGNYFLLFLMLVYDKEKNNSFRAAWSEAFENRV